MFIFVIIREQWIDGLFFELRVRYRSLVNEFIVKAKEHIEMPKLTSEPPRVFIRKIEVMEKTKQYSRIFGNTIIHYTFEYPRQRITNTDNNEKTA